MKQILCSATSQPSPSSYREVSYCRGLNIRYLKGGIHKIQQFFKFSRFKVWNWFPMSINILTHFSPMFHFYTPESIIKTKVFLRFQGAIKIKHWVKWVEKKLDNSWSSYLWYKVKTCGTRWRLMICGTSCRCCSFKFVSLPS